MALFQQGCIAALILAAFNPISNAQSNPDSSASASNSQAQVAPPLPSAPSATMTARYTFPGGKRQLHNYLFATFGPPGLISTAIGAGLDQNKPAPPEWDSGIKGYGERFGSRYGMTLVGETAKYSLGVLLKEDVSYHRCKCRGLLPRTGYAMISTLTARTTSGRTIFSLPALVSPYAGSFTAVNAWYPGRYEQADAFRIGSTSFLFKVAGNFVAEFIAPPR